jgi:hypothetical protein
METEQTNAIHQPSAQELRAELSRRERDELEADWARVAVLMQSLNIEIFAYPVLLPSGLLSARATPRRVQG